MKLTLVLLIVCFAASSLIAGDETIFSGPVESGGYGGPILKIGGIDGENAIWVGGKGGWLINHTLMIGGGGYGLVNEVKKEQIGYLTTRRLGVGYGGFIVEYINKSRKLVHFSFETLIGAGGANYMHLDSFDSWEAGYTDSFFALEPGMSVMVNFTEYFRIGAGVSYLYTSGLELNDLNDSDLSGPLGHLVLKFGKF